MIEKQTRTIQLGRQLAQKEKPKKTIQVAFPWINYNSTRWGNFLIFKLSFRNDGGLTVSIFKFILISKTKPLWGHRHSKQPKTIQLSSGTGITFGTSYIAFQLYLHLLFVTPLTKIDEPFRHFLQFWLLSLSCLWVAIPFISHALSLLPILNPGLTCLKFYSWHAAYRMYVLGFVMDPVA